MTEVKELSNPRPGPKGDPFIGVAREFQSNAISLFERLEKEYGDISFIRLGFIDCWYISNPEYIQQVLQKNNRKYQKATQYKQLQLLLGYGLFNSEGDFWLKQRRLAAPSFHRQKIEGFIDVMNKHGQRLVEEWRGHGEGERDILPDMMKLTLGVTGEALLGKDVTQEASRVGESMDFLVEDIMHRISRVVNWPLWVPTTANRRFKEEKKFLDDVIYKLIKERRQMEAQPDLLSMLMDAEDAETGEKMSDEQLRNELMTIFLAGHETTALALSWTVMLLAENPACFLELKKEVERVFTGDTITVEQVQQLTYCRQVAEESMRLYSPAWIMGRMTIEEDEIGGKRVEKGHDVVISPYMVHRSPKYWDEPDAFKPERFSEENRSKIAKFAYLPFGGGPRLCIGNNFAMIEMQIVLAWLVKNFNWQLSPNHKTELDLTVTLRPANGVKIFINPTNAGA